MSLILNPQKGWIKSKVDGTNRQVTKYYVDGFIPKMHQVLKRTNQATHGYLRKNISLLPTGRWMNQATYECLGKKANFFYLWEDRWTKPLASAWVKNLKSYLRVEGRTKPLTSALVKILSLFTYGWKDEPSHLRVPWKILSLPTYGWTDEPSHSQVPWSKL